MSRIEDAVAAISAANRYEGMYTFPRTTRRRINVVQAVALLRSGRIVADDVLHNLEISRQATAMHKAHQAEVGKLLDTLRPIVPADRRAPCRPKLQVVR